MKRNNNERNNKQILLVLWDKIKHAVQYLQMQ